MRALAPAYAPALFKRTALATTWVQRLYDETEARTEGLYDAAPGKGTFIIDGFKDRQRRHVMNMSKAKVGYPVCRRGVGLDWRRRAAALLDAQPVSSHRGSPNSFYPIPPDRVVKLLGNYRGNGNFTLDFPLLGKTAAIASKDPWL